LAQEVSSKRLSGDIDEPGEPRESSASNAWFDRVSIVVVLTVAFLLRFYQLQNIPLGLDFDEGWDARDALRILAGARPIFLPANNGREVLFMYLQAISIAIFGQTPLALRVVAALAGFLTVLTTYLLFRRMFDRRVALLGSAWIAVSIWHIVNSRIALRVVTLPPLCIATLYFVWCGLQDVGLVKSEASRLDDLSATRRGLRWFALAGITLGLTQYTYVTARFFPIAILLVVTYLALFHRSLFWRALPGLTLTALIAAAVFLPEGLYFLHHPADFSARAAQTTLLNPDLRRTGLARPLFRSLREYLGMFAFRGDGAWDHNLPGAPVFDPLSSVLCALGVVICLRRFRDPACAAALIWFAVMLVPCVLAVQAGPDFLRALSVIPQTFLFPAVGATWLWAWWDRRQANRLRGVPYFVVSAAFVVGAYSGYHGYFDEWARSSIVSSGFRSDRWLAIEAARNLAKQGVTPVYLGAGDPDRPVNAFALDGRNHLPGILQFDSPKTLVQPARNRTVSYVLSGRDLPGPATLQRYFGTQPPTVLAETPDGVAVYRYIVADSNTAFAPAHPVPARFGNTLQIFGFDYPTGAQAGQSIEVQWYWRILTPYPGELTFFHHLYDQNGERRAETDDRAFAPGNAGGSLPAGTRGISTFRISLPADLTTGVYWVDVGVYDHRMLSRLSVFDTAGRRAGDHLALGPIKVHGMPPPVPTIQNRRPTKLGDGIQFLGYDMSPNGPVTKGTLDLTLHWSAWSRPSGRYTVFVQLLDSREHLVAQADGPPDNGRDPTPLWEPGDQIADIHRLVIAPNTPAGTYHILVGMYVARTGQRVPVVDSSGKVVGDHITIPGVIIGPGS